MSESTVEVGGYLPGSRRSQLVIVVIGLLTFPFFINDFWVRIGVGALMWIGLAQSWNMIGGYAGYLDFGHGAYFGIGAFATGVTMVQFGLPFVAGIGLALIVSAIVSYLVAVPTLRLTGAYFAIATWALAEAIKQTALILDITGGTFGLSIEKSASMIIGVPLPIEPTTTFFYYVMLVFLMITMAITYFVFERSAFGYRVKALRDDQEAAQSIGIDTTRIKRQVYVLSCVVAAAFGGAHAWFIVFIHPNDVLAPIITDQMVIMVLLGGLGTLGGPVIGGMFVFLLQRLSAAYLGTSTFYLPLIGVLLMLVVLFAPSGIIGILRGEVGVSELKQNTRELAEKFDLL